MSAEEHMANFQAARALMGKGTSSAKKGAKKSALKKAQLKEVTMATAIIRFLGQRLVASQAE